MFSLEVHTPFNRIFKLFAALFQRDALIECGFKVGKDNGKTFGTAHVIEGEDRGYCYPAVFETRDGHLLCAYCRGGKEDKACLCRLGISRIEIASL